MPACSICISDNQDTLEALGVEALQGKRSWRDAERDGGLTHGVALKNHMERHYVAPGKRELDEASDKLDSLMAEAIEDLLHQMAVAPPDIKPLYALAITNLRGLSDTKPSQQHLIAALKAIHEITGMKSEQQHLLAYAKNFGVLETVEARPALEA